LVFRSATPIPGPGRYRYFELDGAENPALEVYDQRSPFKLVNPPEATVAPAPRPKIEPAGFPSLAVAQQPHDRISPVVPRPGDPAALARLVTDQEELKFAVVNLPDFEEMYAIQNTNIAAKTKYAYGFADGSKLAWAEGNYNATEVPVKFLNTVQNLIGAISSVRLHALKALTGGGVGGKFQLDTTDTTLLYIVIEQKIEPGLYRLQKSWGRAASAADAGLAPDQCLGLITELGFSVRTSTRILTVAELAAELNK
jgi:hypothetical protein